MESREENGGDGRGREGMMDSYKCGEEGWAVLFERICLPIHQLQLGALPTQEIQDAKIEYFGCYLIVRI